MTGTRKRKRKRLQLTKEQDLQHEWLIKRAAYLMRKTKRALADYKQTRRNFQPCSIEEAEVHITAIKDKASTYFKRRAEEREALAQLAKFDAMARGEDLAGEEK